MGFPVMYIEFMSCKPAVTTILTPFSSINMLSSLMIILRENDFQVKKNNLKEGRDYKLS